MRRGQERFGVCARGASEVCKEAVRCAHECEVEQALVFREHPDRRADAAVERVFEEVGGARDAVQSGANRETVSAFADAAFPRDHGRRVEKELCDQIEIEARRGCECVLLVEGPLEACIVHVRVAFGMCREADVRDAEILESARFEHGDRFCKCAHGLLRRSRDEEHVVDARFGDERIEVFA